MVHIGHDVNRIVLGPLLVAVALVWAAGQIRVIAGETLEVWNIRPGSHGRIG